MEQYKFSGHKAHRYVNDLHSGDDGFYYFLPTSKIGFISAYELIQIAELLNWINKPWQEEIENYFLTNSQKLV